MGYSVGYFGVFWGIFLGYSWGMHFPWSECVCMRSLKILGYFGVFFGVFSVFCVSPGRGFLGYFGVFLWGIFVSVFLWCFVWFRWGEGGGC